MNGIQGLKKNRRLARTVTQGFGTRKEIKMADIEISEKKLEDYIFKCLDEEIYPKGLDELPRVEFCQKTIRQLNIAPYGVIDIVSFGSRYDYNDNLFLNIIIYELKRGQIDKCALVQSLRYVSGIRDYYKSIGGKVCDPCIDVVLIGQSINEDMKFIPQAYDFLNILTYDIDISDGLSLKNEDTWRYNDKARCCQTKKAIVCADYLNAEFAFDISKK